MARRELEEVEKPCNDILEWAGFDVTKLSQPRPAIRMTPGIPDCYVRHPSGFRAWIEYKHPDTSGGVTEAQQAWHDQEELCGGEIAVIHSPEELAEWLQSHGFDYEVEVAT